MADRPPAVIRLRDLLNFQIQAQDGTFGRVSDAVFDRDGNIQYLLGSYQGRVYPLPLTQSALSWSPNTLRYDVPVMTLQQLTINPQDLPTLRNQAFDQRMQQVFGSSFGRRSSATVSGAIPQNRAGFSGGSTTSTVGGSSMANSSAAGAQGSANGSSNSTAGGISAKGPGRPANDAWNWPNNAAMVQAGAGLPAFSTQIGSFGSGITGTGTANNAGIQSSSQIMNNSSVDAFGRNVIANGQAGLRSDGPLGNIGTTAGGATSGTTAGAGTRGTTAGAGTKGSTAGAGTKGTTSGAGTKGSTAGAVRPVGPSGAGTSGSTGAPSGGGS